MNPESTISAIRPSMIALVSTTICGSPVATRSSWLGAGRRMARRLGGGDQVVPLGDGQPHHAEAQEQRDAERQPGPERARELRQRQAEQQAQQQPDEQAEDRGDELGGRELLDLLDQPAGRDDGQVRQDREADDQPGDVQAARRTWRSDGP